MKKDAHTRKKRIEAVSKQTDISLSGWPYRSRLIGVLFAFRVTEQFARICICTGTSVFILVVLLMLHFLREDVIYKSYHLLINFLS